MPDYFRAFWRQRDQRRGVSVDVPARQNFRDQFWGAIGINIFQGGCIDLNGLSGTRITAMLLIEFKADRRGSLGQLEGRSTVAAEFFPKFENAAIRVFNRPCVPAFFVGKERELPFDRTHGWRFWACRRRWISVACRWKH